MAVSLGRCLLWAARAVVDVAGVAGVSDATALSNIVVKLGFQVSMLLIVLFLCDVVDIVLDCMLQAKLW
jgi:hypothetical protein